MDADTLQPLLLLERSTSAITDIKYTPQTAHRPTDCGHLMAAASRDLCIYVYDVTKGYQVPPPLPARKLGHDDMGTAATRRTGIQSVHTVGCGDVK
jgi:hypothetical protein